MHTGKPHFPDVLVRIVWGAEKVLSKKRPALVDGHGVANDVQVGISRSAGKREMDGIIDPSKRADRVPDANKVRLAFPRKRLLEVRRYRKIDRLLLDHPDGKRDQPFVIFVEQPDNMQHSAQSPRGVGSPTEAEDIHLVRGLEGSH